MEYAVADTGVWYAMFDPKDQYWGRTTEKEEFLDLFGLVVPWPTMYETLRTTMVKNRPAVQRLKEYLSRHHVVFLDDSPYRRGALEQVFSPALHEFRRLSMVDCMIRLMLEDVNVRVKYLATFNERDFADVCHKRRIEMF